MPTTTRTRATRATLERVSVALARLGESAEEVASTLVEHGAAGYCGQIRACPVAIYLERCWPHEDFRVMSDNVYMGRTVATGQRIPLPYPVAQFVEAFDGGRFAELDLDTPCPPSFRDDLG